MIKMKIRVSRFRGYLFWRSYTGDIEKNERLLYPTPNSDR
jgi:hypothetical protein